MEGAGFNINIQGWAGMAISYSADEELSPIEEMKSCFRILALSENPQSPQLWAHYANNYSGICLCFSTIGILSEAKPIRYSDIKHEKNPRGEKQLKNAVREGFYQKQSGWSYEKEWRIVREKTDDPFLYFGEKELVGIIFGQNISNLDKRELLKRIPGGLKVMKTKIGYQNPQVNLLPIDYEVEYSGKPIDNDYINDIEKYLLG